MKRVVVVGGGLSGLSAGCAVLHDAEKKSVDLDLRVLERDDIVGGKIRSVREDGYLCEGGPNGFLDNKPSTMALARQLGMDETLYKSDSNAAKRFVFTDGELKRIPEDPLSFVLSDILSIRGKIRLAAEFFMPVGDPAEDESVSNFVRRRLGDEALEKLIDPMSAGIYAGDPNVMSLKSCFPKVQMLEQQFGGMLKGMMAMQKMAKERGVEGPQSAGPGGELWSFREGTGELTDKLAATLGPERVSTGTSVVSLIKAGEGWRVRTSDGESIECDAVILASPAYDSGALLGPLDERAATLLTNIPYVKAAVVGIGFDREGMGHPLDGFGFLIPRTEGRRILGSLWSSAIFPNRAPKGKALMTIIIGGARSPELVTLGDGDLLDVVRQELAATMGITTEPAFAKIFRWDKAIPQYIVGHSERVAEIEERVAALGNLFLGGNAFYGIGINDCTARAEVLGPAVCDALFTA